MRPLPSAGGWAWAGEAEARAWLEDLGLRPGQRLALGGLNRPGTVQVLAAALRLGLTIIPLNRRLGLGELAALHQRARADRTAAHADHPLAGAVACAALPDDYTRLEAGGPKRPDVMADVPVTRWVTAGNAGTLWGAKPPASSPQPPAPHVGGSLVLFTSGTSGSPKAVRLGEAAIAAAVAAHVQALGLTATDTWSLPLPLDHVGGIMATLRALACGCAVTLEATPGAEATGSSLVPTQLARLVAAGTPPPPLLRTALIGGGPLDATLATAARNLGWPLRETYGLTEMGSMVTLDGITVPGALLRLDEGRIAVGGPMRFDGYEVEGRLEGGGAWHVTDDLGEFSEGRLRVSGRCAELIVSGGENVAAREVEAALLAHPLVAEACVVGLPDATWGEMVATALVVRGPCAPADLDAWLSSRLAGFKRPRRWLLVPTLPRTALGKVQRHLVLELFAQSQAGGWKLEAGGPKWPDVPVTSWVTEGNSGTLRGAKPPASSPQPPASP